MFCGHQRRVRRWILNDRRNQWQRNSTVFYEWVLCQISRLCPPVHLGKGIITGGSGRRTSTCWARIAQKGSSDLGICNRLWQGRWGWGYSLHDRWGSSRCFIISLVATEFVQQSWARCLRRPSTLYWSWHSTVMVGWKSMRGTELLLTSLQFVVRHLQEEASRR